MRKRKIFQHPGMGDYIICKGLIKHLIDYRPGPYELTANIIYRESIDQLYSDCPFLNIRYINIEDLWHKAWTEHNSTVLNEFDIKIGIEYIKDRVSNWFLRFDRMFYEQFGLCLSLRWRNFSLKRNMFREKSLFESFKVKEGEYVFLHEKENLNINKSHIKQSRFRIITPIKGLTPNIFDYCYLIEHAAEIHCIDSSFKNLADSLPVNGHLFYHLNRQSNPFFYSSCNWNWKEIKY